MSGVGQLVRREDPTIKIVGTADIIPAVAGIEAVRIEAGKLRWIHDGGSTVDWNGQAARRAGDWRLFVDEYGELVSEADVALKLDDGTLQWPTAPGAEDA